MKGKKLWKKDYISSNYWERKVIVGPNAYKLMKKFGFPVRKDKYAYDQSKT